MKHFLLILLLVFGCCSTQAETIDPPKEIRQSNYGPSCAHAATITMLRWQGQPTMADYWRKSYYGAETFAGLASKAIYTKLGYALSRNGKLDVLNYATTTQRGAVVDWSGKKGIYRNRFGKEGGHHAVFFCGFDQDTVTIVDPNTNKNHTFSKSAFLAHWRRCGGRAFMTLYSSPKPKESN